MMDEWKSACYELEERAAKNRIVTIKLLSECLDLVDFVEGRKDDSERSLHIAMLKSKLKRMVNLV